MYFFVVNDYIFGVKHLSICILSFSFKSVIVFFLNQVFVFVILVEKCIYRGDNTSNTVKVNSGIVNKSNCLLVR